jgi:hypothetical protein
MRKVKAYVKWEISSDINSSLLLRIVLKMTLKKKNVLLLPSISQLPVFPLISGRSRQENIWLKPFSYRFMKTEASLSFYLSFINRY